MVDNASSTGTLARVATGLAIVGIVSSAALASSLYGRVAQQQEVVVKLRGELALAQSMAGEVASLRAELDEVDKHAQALELRLQSVETRRVAQGPVAGRRGRVADAPAGASADAPAIDDDPDSIDMLTAEVAQRLADSPALQAGAQVDPEAVRTLVAHAEQERDKAREERRATRRVEAIRGRVARYAQTLGMNGAQSGALERILTDAGERASKVRERVREGELDWSEARSEWESIRGEADRAISSELGPDMAAKVDELRAQDEPWGRSGGGGRDSRGGDAAAGATRP